MLACGGSRVKKMITLVFLGVALTVLAASARAQDLTGAATGTAGLAVPDGYDLLTIKRGPAINAPDLPVDKRLGDTATIISVRPSADAPATASISWSGYVSVMAGYSRTTSK